MNWSWKGEIWGKRTTEQSGVGNGSTAGMGAVLALPAGFPGAEVGVGALTPYMGGGGVGRGIGKRMELRMGFGKRMGIGMDVVVRMETAVEMEMGRG